MQVYLGIDPGVTGAVAFLGDNGELLDVRDMELQSNNYPDLAFVGACVRGDGLTDKPTVMCLEECTPYMPNAKSMGKLMGHMWAWAGAAAAQGLRLFMTAPKVWKPVELKAEVDAMKESGFDLGCVLPNGNKFKLADKQWSIKQATHRWPGRGKEFAPKVKGHGRAEAALLAAHGWRQIEGDAHVRRVTSERRRRTLADLDSRVG